MSENEFFARSADFQQVPAYDAPYDIYINPYTILQLLQEKSKKSAFVLDIKVDTYENASDELASFTYENDPMFEVILYSDEMWQRYLEAVSDVNVLIHSKNDREDEANELFDDLLYTRRVPSYLRTAPEERARAFAERLLINAVSRELNASLLHELQHLIDYVQGKYSIWFSLSNLFDGMLEPLIYNFDPIEKNANRFEEKYRNDPVYRNLVVMRKKN